MQVRPGQRDDAQALSALAVQVWLHTYATEGVSALIARHVLAEFSVGKFEALLSEASSVVLVAEQGHGLVGYAAVTADRACAAFPAAEVELATLYVQEHFVRTGVGRALLNHAQRWAIQRAGSALWLTVNARNANAIAFYAAHGYTQQGITPFELGDEKHENLVLVGNTLAGTE